MKIILLSIFLFISLLSSEQLPYTLENLKKLNLYYVDKSGLFDKQEQNKMKTTLKNKLLSHGFNLHATDPSTLVVIIETIDIDDTIIANISLLVGEEVITKREKNIQTMALTYHDNKFIELDEARQEIKEIINSMLGDFLKLYQEDME